MMVNLDNLVCSAGNAYALYRSERFLHLAIRRTSLPPCFVSRRPTSTTTTTATIRWKLSTRERKKSLEDSLKTSDYSEHHLIPVYGFRRYDNTGEREIEGGGWEGSGGGLGGTMGAEERQTELRRLEARALVAERASLERRTRAEGGAEGAAFARAMCRRATARAEWIQKVDWNRRHPFIDVALLGCPHLHKASGQLVAVMSPRMAAWMIDEQQSNSAAATKYARS